jgi:hypothetical protein
MDGLAEKTAQIADIVQVSKEKIDAAHEESSGSSPLDTVNHLQAISSKRSWTGYVHIHSIRKTTNICDESCVQGILQYGYLEMKSSDYGSPLPENHCGFVVQVSYSQTC